MNKKPTFALAVAALVLCSGSGASALTYPISDDSFAQTVQRTDDQEIADARYVLSQTQNPHVRRFATEVVSDRATANVELLRSARDAHVFVPQLGRREYRFAPSASLAGLSGTDLDQAYLRNEINQDESLLDWVQTEQANAGSDPAMKQFAMRAEPIVKRHLDAAGNMLELAVGATPGPRDGNY